MKTKKYIMLCCFSLWLYTMIGQTSNEGEVVILQDTQMSIMDDFNNTATATFMNDGELYLYSNLNNDGLLSFPTGGTTGLTRFEGSSLQTISGTMQSEFYDVLFNNPSIQPTFQLSGEISIENEADFSQGILQNDGFGGRVIFERLADHISTSNDSHVDGIVEKNGDTAFEYPIGDSGFYRSATITAPDAITDVYSGKYYFENSDPLYPHNLAEGVIEFINPAEYWTVTRDNGTSNIVLTLSWDDATTPTSISTAPTSAIHIVRWDSNLGFWVDEGGVVDEVNQTVTTFTEVSGYGVFTLARVKEDIILPGNLVVYNSVTPNGDGDNDFFLISGISNYPDNEVQIFNRWGVKVYEAKAYNETDNVFRGISDGRITISQDEQLPTGTYFYILNYTYTDGGNSQVVKKSGYLYINGDNN